MLQLIFMLALYFSIITTIEIVRNTIDRKYNRSSESFLIIFVCMLWNIFYAISIK